jgi:hypothetical protein
MTFRFRSVSTNASGNGRQRVANAGPGHVFLPLKRRQMPCGDSQRGGAGQTGELLDMTRNAGECYLLGP